MSANDGRISKPWLVQRVENRYNKVVPEFPTFDQMYVLDYMGSAEFEWGAIPKSFSRVMMSYKKYNVVKTEIENWKGEHLLLLIFGGEETQEQYVEYLKQLANYEIRLKEFTHFPQQVSGKNWKGEQLTDQSFESRTKIWWDIENDIFFCFGQDRMNLLCKVLENSRQLKESKKER